MMMKLYERLIAQKKGDVVSQVSVTLLCSPLQVAIWLSGNALALINVVAVRRAS